MQLIDNKTLKEIINKIKYEGKFRTQGEIARRLGYTQQYLSDVLNGRVPISVEFTNKLIETFPELNTICLPDSEAEILKTPANSNTIATLLCEVPLLPISAQGGSLNDFVVSVKDSDCEKVISPIKGAEYAMPVAGDSMSPEYPSGSQILIKRINERAFIDWGKVYVLDTCNGTVIKKLMPPTSDDKNLVRCVSINQDYPPFEVNLCDVYGVYKVLLCMSIK